MRSDESLGALSSPAVLGIKTGATRNAGVELPALDGLDDDEQIREIAIAACTVAAVARELHRFLIDNRLKAEHSMGANADGSSPIKTTPNGIRYVDLNVAADRTIPAN